MTAQALKSCSVYTPKALAESMVLAIGDKNGATWLEPCHGKGAFLEALKGAGIARNRIYAIDIDRTRADADRLASVRRGVDFLKWAPKARLRFDRIIGNPPYLPIARLRGGLLRSAAGTLDVDGSTPIGKESNLWYAFVAASVRLLKRGGCMSFILPSCSEFADYSGNGRAAIGHLFRCVEVYRCRQPLFDSVQEGTVVLIARDYLASSDGFRKRCFNSREELIAGLRRPAIRRRPCPIATAQIKSEWASFGDVARVSLGGVTGDSRYFLMTESERSGLGLPKSAMMKVVTRARHLGSPALTESGWERLRRAEERVWLFNPRGPALAHSAVQAYLNLSPEEGGCKRGYKIENRKPWYRTLMPPHPHAFISGMANEGPWLCFNETQYANATNTLYVVRFVNGLTKNMQYAAALMLLTSASQRQLRRAVRVYADGLRKMEPGTIMAIKVPSPKPGINYRREYRKAVQALLNNSRQNATAIADRCAT